MTIELTHLSQLRLSEKNVRQTHNDADLEEMKASLMHHGLQQNLVTFFDKEIDGAHMAVIAGGRRLRAMQALQADGETIPNITDWMIPCRILTMAEASSATEHSLVENVIRTAMHPADQFEAWSTMMDEGRSSSDIATRFGVSEQLVRQRMKLGKVSPVLMQAYRDNDATLEQLMAFTITDDHARQLDVWDQVKNSYNKHPNTIRRMLTEKAVSSSSKLARYVGEAAYEAAGGLITRDLFEEDCYFENAALLEMLALKMLQESVVDEKQQWKDVVVTLDEERSQYEGFDAIQREYIAIPQDLLDEWEQKTARFEQLENGIYGDDDAEEIDEEMLQAEYDRLAAEIDAMKHEVESYLGYPDHVKLASSLFVWLGQDGKLQSRAMKPAQVTDDTEKQAMERSPTSSGSADSQDVSAPAASKEDNAAYSQSLTHDLGVYRNQMIQAAIGDDFATSFDMMTYSLATRYLSDAYHQSLIDVSLSRFADKTALDDADFTASGIKRQAQREGLNLSWVEAADEAQRFEAFCALGISDKQAIFSYCTAYGMTGGMYRPHPALDDIAARLSLVAHEQWRPTDTNFFNRLKKPQLLKLVDELLGEAWVSKVADHKKGELATWLGRVFDGNPSATSGMDAATLERIRSWLPEAMRFGVSDEADDEALQEIVDDEPSVTVPDVGEALPAFLLDQVA